MQPNRLTDPMLSAESCAEPARPATWYRRLRESTWFPIVGKGVAITAVMLGFSTLGAVSMATTEPGVHVATQAMPLSPIEWLAPTPAASSAAPASKTAAAVTPETAPLGLRPACGQPGSLCEQQKKPPEGLTSDGKVILNVASAEVLTQLPGVGARRAEAIIQLRERLKRFRKPSDLLRVRGIGVRSLKRMLPHFVLDPPKADPPKADPPKADAPKADAPAGAPKPPAAPKPPGAPPPP